MRPVSNVFAEIFSESRGPVRAVVLLGVFLCCLLPVKARGLEGKGELAVEGIGFIDDGAFPEQDNFFLSVAGKVEFYQELRKNLSLTLEGFYRLDNRDHERSHGDVRIAEFLYYTDSWELAAGVGRVFWGATEFVHLVDIINQTDLVESLDGEEKLGQPMLHLTIPRDRGAIEAFVMPWFRERTFPGAHGRFRTPLVVDTSAARYESGSRQHHIDAALRYSTTIGSADIGLSYFTGTGREPVLLPSLQKDSILVLIPYYEQIGQTGLDLQWSVGDWLIKGEAFYRTGQKRSFPAASLGFEYTISSLAGTLMDLGLLGEYVFDDRNDALLATPFDNDIMAGLRLVVNDQDDSRVLLGVIRDIRYGSTIITVEASRRLGESMRLNLEAYFFPDMDSRDPASILARDDSIKLELVWYW